MLLFIDLEANGNPIAETIQIGICLTDNNCQKRKYFSKYIKPKEPVTLHVENLTGITNEMLKNESDFKTVFQECHDWIIANRLHTNGTLEKINCFAWGDDFKDLRKEAKLHKCSELFEEAFPKNKYFDFQKEFSKNVVFGDVKLTERIGLSNAKSLLGLESHVCHDGLKDAIDTCDVYQKYKLEKKSFDKAVLEKMYEEKKPHIERMKQAKENALKVYFDALLEQLGCSFVFKISESMQRLLLTCDQTVFREMGKLTLDSMHDYKLAIVASKVDEVLFMDIVVTKDGESIGHFKVKANYENKRFLKKFLQTGWEENYFKS